MKQVIVLFLIQALIFSCASKSETEKKDRAKSDNEANSLNSIPSGFIDMGDSLRLPPFEIEVTLDESAEKKLSADKETIIVSAYLSGMPKESVDIALSESGEVEIGGRDIELEKPGIAKFDNIYISRKAYEALADKDFEILINIYSGRKSSNLNLLDAEILQKPISSVFAKRYLLNAKLIED